MVYINTTGKHNEVWLDKPYATITVECPECPSTEDAYSSGWTDGSEDGYHKGYQSGSTDGWSDGYPSGYTDGYGSGYTDGLSACSGGSCEEEWQDGYDSGYTDGSNSVDCTDFYNSGVTDGIAQQKAKLVSTAITENGTYTNEDGFSSVEVNVPTGQTINNQHISIDISRYFKYFPNEQTYSISGNGIPYCVFPDSGYTGIERVCIYTNIDASEAIEEGYNSGYTDGLNACSGGNEDLIANLQGDYFIIPEGTTKLRNYAFYGTSLSSITIPSTVTEIGAGAFSSTNLTGITIPNSVSLINSNAFAGTGIEEITIPDTVLFLGSGVLQNTYSLTAATLPSGLTSIPPYLFQSSRLHGITLPTGITRIEQNAFGGCSLTGNLDIPAAVTGIGANAFANVNTLSSMTFESTVPAVLSGTATYNASLGSTAYTWPIYVPCEAVDTYKTAWPIYAHRIMCDSGDTPDTGDTGYTPFSVSGDITNKFVYSGDSVQTVQLSSSGFLDIVTSMYVNGEQITPVSAITMEPGKTYYIDYYTNTNYSYVPYTSFNDTDVVETEVRGAHITQLQGCYGGCKGLTAATLSSAITETNGTFLNCENLASVNAGNSTMIVHDDSFRNCSSLTGINLSPSLIGANAFAGSGLRSFSIGSNCTSIGNAAFSACTALTEVVINGRSLSNNLAVGASMFSDCPALSSVTFFEFERRIANGMFRNCTALTAITLPSNNIGSESFYNTGLRSITVQEAASSIGRNAFYNCQYLNSVVLPSTITSIGDAAFAGTNLLTGVTINATTPPSLATPSGGNASLGGTNVNIYVPASALEDYKAAQDFAMYAQNDKIFAIQ